MTYTINKADNTVTIPLDSLEHVIHELLAARRKIVVIWSVEDVQSSRPDLQDWQAWEVLRDLRVYHDAGDGISWETVEVTADMLFPEPTTTFTEETVA